MKKKIIILCLLFSLIAVPSIAMSESAPTLTIRDLYGEYDLIDAMIGQGDVMWHDLFPMEVNLGERTEASKAFFELTDEISRFELHPISGVSLDELVVDFDYELGFELEGNGDYLAFVQLRFFQNSEVVQIKSAHNGYHVCGEDKLGFYTIDAENKATLRAVLEEREALFSE